MATIKKQKDVKMVRSGDHRSHYIIGAIPQWTEDDLRLHLYNEIIEGEDGPFYANTAQLIIPRSALPRIIESLKTALRNEGKSTMAEAKVYPDLATGLEGQEKRTPKKKVQKIRRK